MSEVTIFKQQSVAPTRDRGLSPLAQALATNANSKRIAAKNGKFHKVVNGEKVASISGSINVIVINALNKVSRQFYDAIYDPDAEPTLPDCWSNLGDVPDPKATNAQALNCASCPKNIDGSGPKGKGRACRFQRRIAVLLEGDPSGDIYQMSLPSLSLFGKGSGNAHPFESYLSYLAANGESIDRIVTEVSLDDDADVTVMKFSPVRHLDEPELDLVEAAQQNPVAKSVVQFTVAQHDGVTKKPKDNGFTEEVAAKKEELEPSEPVKRATKAKQEEAPPTDLASVIDAWGKD